MTEVRSLLTLNLSDPSKERAAGLLEWLWHQDEEVLVLTEVGRSPGSALVERVCRAAGHDVHRTSTTELGVLVVGRGVPVVPDERHEPLALLPHRVAPVLLGGLPVLGVYGPASDPVRYSGGPQRQRKRDWLAALEPWLADWSATVGRRAVVVGDLNLVDPVHDSALPYVLAEETACYERLTDADGLGLVDAYRTSHPDGTAPSWVDHTGEGCRYDHALVTPDLAGQARADLDHAPRLEGLTDHSALRLRLDAV